MKSATWLVLKTLLADALEHPCGEREAFLARACQGRPALFEQACELLEAAPGDDFLEPPLVAEGSEDDHARRWLGRRVGSLRIEQLVARGGMGHVFLATAEDGTRQAAIKIPNESSDVQDAARALEHEHQVLSALDHPYIVRSYGTAHVDNVPCLILDYVVGTPIDDYCTRHQLGVIERVALVVRSCAAIAHVHARGIVHADLKPANLLVTSRGGPRLIDFGIAQRLDEHPASCPTGRQPAHGVFAALTPECAAPEQWRNEPVTAASDVYATGAMLYRLLTGHLPHAHSGRLSALQRLYAVCNDDPLPLAELLRSGQAPAAAGLPPDGMPPGALTGDLDRIVGRALARDPLQRYADIAAFAQDLSDALLHSRVVAPDVIRSGTECLTAGTDRARPHQGSSHREIATPTRLCFR